MGTTYFIPQGTRVQVSCPDNPETHSRPHTTRRGLSFVQPAAETGDVFEFRMGQWLIRVSKRKVFRLTGGSGQGAIEQCE